MQRTPQVRKSQVRKSQVRTPQVRNNQVRTTQDRTPQDRNPQVRTPQARTTQSPKTLQRSSSGSPRGPHMTHASAVTSSARAPLELHRLLGRVAVYVATLGDARGGHAVRFDTLVISV